MIFTFVLFSRILAVPLPLHLPHSDRNGSGATRRDATRSPPRASQLPPLRAPLTHHYTPAVPRTLTTAPIDLTKGVRVQETLNARFQKAS